jgi:Tfp pilus assembly protein PilF
MPLALVGCAALRSPQSRARDVHPQQQERKHEAIEDYERRRNQAELQAARTRAEQGDLSGCATAVENVLRRDPNNRDARLLMADVHLGRENTAAAEKLLRELVTENPGEPQAQHALALLLESTGRAAEARPLFQKAAAEAPDNPLYAASYKSSDDANSSGVNQSSGAKSAGREELTAIAGTSEGRSRLQQSLALMEADDAAGSARVALTAMEVEPHNRQLPLAYSVHALRSGHPSAAVTALEAAARRFPAAPEILRALAAAHLDGGNPQAAQVVLRQALSLDNADPLSYFLLGQVLRQQGQPREAEQAFAQAHRLDPRYPQR